MDSHPHLPIAQTFIEISQHWIVGGAHDGAMELAIELDELERRFLLLLLPRQQPVQFRRQEFPDVNGAPHAKVLDEAARLHDRFDFQLRDRRNESALLRHNSQKAIRLEAQQRLAHRSSRHAGGAAHFRFGQERAVGSRQRDDMLLQPREHDVLRRLRLGARAHGSLWVGVEAHNRHDVYITPTCLASASLGF